MNLLRTILFIVVVASSGCGQQKNPTNNISSIKSVEVDLVALLDTIQRTEREPLVMRDEMMKKHGADSDEFRKYEALAHENHAINEVRVFSILSDGWPDNDKVGEQGDRTLADVLQHCDLETRLKYLPMMKQAVLDDKLNAQLLVRAEDRIATDRNLPQIYGGQMKYYPETKSFNVWPVHDPINIDKRRALIGLPPIAEHLMDRFEFKWVLEDQIRRSEAFARDKTNSPH